MDQNRLSQKGGNLLPEGWAETTLSEIATVNPKNGELNTLLSGFIPMALAPTDFNGHLEFEEREWDEIKKKYTHFANGDVIFAKVTPCFENGKAAIVSDLPNGIGAGSSEFYVLRPLDKGISASYIFANIKSHEFMQTGAENMTGAVGLRRVPRKFVEGFKVNLPPQAEQKVIADKLDTLLAQVETTKARLDRIPQILKTFRQSVLAAAVSGKLTEEWRVNKQYVIISEALGKLAKFIDYRGRTPKKTASGTPLITAKNIKPGFISREPREFIAEEDYDSWMTRGIPKYGDVLMTTEAPMGNVANIDIEESFALAQRAICLQFNENLNPYFVSIYMQASEFQKALNENATGSTVKGIKAALLKKIKIEFPPMGEQIEIVRRVEELFASADSIAQKTNQALDRVNNLTQSILAKAFRGELTADWRSQNFELISGENSAKALLVKIKSEREALKKQPKPKRIAVKKKTGSRMSKQIIKVVDALKEAGKPLSGQQLLAVAGYPSDSSTDQLEQFFLDIREALTSKKSIVKLDRSDDDQDWFALAEADKINKA
ncbi:MAG: type I restriction enzyme S subunit [Paraglaciecola sp.]|jgi:type I restriction enzyme S subunit